MPQIPDATRSFVWSVVLLLFLRFASVYGLVFLSANFGVLLRATINVQAGSKVAPRNSGRSLNNVGNRDENRRSQRNRQTRDTPSPKKPLSPVKNTATKLPPIIHHYNHPSSPPPYSLVAPPKSGNEEPLPKSILTLYEDIIAADAQTIQVQQETLCAQQETIRAQAQMIRSMRHLLECQDGRVEELENMLGAGGDDEVGQKPGV